MPPGFILIVVWNAVTGLLMCVLGGFGLSTLALLAAPDPGLVMAILAFLAVMAVAQLALGVLSIISAYGIWQLAPWGRRFAIGVAAAVLVYQFLSFATGAPLLLNLVFLAIPAAIIVYLRRPDARSRFPLAPPAPVTGT